MYCWHHSGAVTDQKRSHIEILCGADHRQDTRRRAKLERRCFKEASSVRVGQRTKACAWRQTVCNWRATFIALLCSGISFKWQGNGAPEQVSLGSELCLGLGRAATQEQADLGCSLCVARLPRSDERDQGCAPGCRQRNVGAVGVYPFRPSVPFLRLWQSAVRGPMARKLRRLC
jgi:hypothetical protein